MDLENLIIKIQAIASGVQAGVDEAKEALQGLDKANQHSSEVAKKASQDDAQSKAAQAAAYAALSAAATVALTKIISSIWKGVEASNAYANSLIGLRSIVEGTGNDFGDAKKFIDDFTMDGLIPAADAATALKNLLARGYTNEQASAVLMRLKDAAAFGRQSTLALGEAVKSASEGIKNENSILVDNAGVTKNVAKMWEEYANQIGKATTDLTQAEKIQAEYNGIMAETAHQVGDAVKYSAEFSGAQSLLAAEGTKAWQAFGDAMKPVLEVMVRGATDGVVALREFIQENKPLVAAMVAGTSAAAGFYVVVGGYKALVPILTSVKVAAVGASGALSVTPLGWVAIGVTVFAALAAALATVESTAEKANRKIRESIDELSSLRGQQQSLQEVSAEYEALISKVNRTIDEQKRLEQIERDLVHVHGLAANAVNAYGEAIITGSEAIQAEIELRREKIKLMRQDVILTADLYKQETEAASAKRKAEIADLIKTKNVYASYIKMIDEKLAAGERVSEHDRLVAENYRKRFLPDLEQRLKDLQTAETEAAQQLISTSMAVAGEALDAVAAEGYKINDALRKVAYDRVKELTEAGHSYEEAVSIITKEVSQLAKDHSIFQAFVDSQLPAIAQGGDQLAEAIRAALAKTAESIEAENISLEEKKQKYADLISQIGSVDLGDSLDQIALLMPGDTAESEEALRAYMAALGEAAGKLLKLTNISKEARQVIGKMLAAEYKRAEDALDDMADKAEDDFNAVVRSLMDLDEALGVIDDYAQKIRKIGREKALIETLKKAEKGSDEYKAALQELASLSGISAETIAANLGLIESQVAADEQSMAGLINQMISFSGVNPSAGNILAQLQAIANGADAAKAAAANLVLQLLSLTNLTIDDTGKVSGVGPVVGDPPKATKRGGGGSRKSEYDKQLENMEHLKRIGALSAEEEIAWLERIQRKYAKTADEKLDIEERLYEARKEYQQKLYDDELKALEHRKAMGQLTVEQEIENLRRILAEHAKTADQRMEIEERIYELQQSLRDDEVEDLDRLSDGIIDALQARYEEQKRIEEDRVKESINGWKKWADESKKAIQAQIDALDELNKTADREAQDAAELRKIEATKQLIIYEKDAYNREQLEKELAKLEEERATRLRKNAIEDEKERLRAEMEAVDEKAAAEQDALNAQLDEIDKVYEERLKMYNLQAEAERLIASNNQQAIIDLIKSYAPDYETTGKTLGERLYDGFKSAVQDVEAWFEEFNRQIEEYQQQLAQAALDAADAYYQSQNGSASSGGALGQQAGVTVYQENTFTMPVESPAETSRRIRQTNEALAQQLLMG